MVENEYKPRVIDSLLSRKLRGKGAVLIEGAKWCGKTSTAEQQAKSVVYMSDPKFREQYQLFVDTHPEMLLEGETPRLIDDGSKRLNDLFFGACTVGGVLGASISCLF